MAAFMRGVNPSLFIGSTLTSLALYVTSYAQHIYFYPYNFCLYLRSFKCEAVRTGCLECWRFIFWIIIEHTCLVGNWRLLRVPLVLRSGGACFPPCRRGPSQCRARPLVGPTSRSYRCRTSSSPQTANMIYSILSLLSVVDIWNAALFWIKLI